MELAGSPAGGDDVYPDLVRFEPQTGAVNVANAAAGLTLLTEAGRMDRQEARAAVGKISRAMTAGRPPAGLTR